MQTQPYDQLAGEYYDEARHPTCAALREGSLLLLEKAIAALDRVQHVVEVGCGKSVFCDLPQRFVDLIAVDSSQAMLSHSKKCLSDSAQFVHAHAEETHLESSSADLVISSLGDPYNHRELWGEVARILRPGGSVLYTTPSFTWASKYRTVEGDPEHVAVFVTANGEAVETSSYVMSHEEQKAMIEDCGFKVLEVSEVCRQQLKSKAPKLQVLAPEQAVVTIYSAVRR